DPTEGGIGAAVHEMAYAAGLRITVELDKVRLYPVTGDVCGLFGIDPLGLISSGALLIAIGTGRAERLIARLHAARIEAAAIGSFEAGRGVKAIRNGKPTKLKWYERDELVRLEDSRNLAQNEIQPRARKRRSAYLRGDIREAKIGEKQSR
ncbi:MAG TPA: AIR synthase-related protein, partial [Candidatus Binataceae bacterium]|nr:AIR synthase-related protein [Candidatus Binataceae bacterium]